MNDNKSVSNTLETDITILHMFIIAELHEDRKNTKAFVKPWFSFSQICNYSWRIPLNKKLVILDTIEIMESDQLYNISVFNAMEIDITNRPYIFYYNRVDQKFQQYRSLCLTFQ